jgi:hypothetical protein
MIPNLPASPVATKAFTGHFQKVFDTFQGVGPSDDWLPTSLCPKSQNFM